MKKMHEQMARLYQAAKRAGKLESDVDQSGMARLLNIAPQNVNNWEARGPSKVALLHAQDTFGVNATWVQTGAGPMFIGGDTPMQPQWPFRRVEIARVLALDGEERAFLEAKLDSELQAAENRMRNKKSSAEDQAA